MMRLYVGLGILLLVLWALFWIVFRVVAWMVHLLVVVGLLFLLYGLMKRGVRQTRDRFGRQEPPAL
jgi:hypothetical protein